MSTDFADAIDSAADYIMKHGWVQGTHEDFEGRVCATEALYKSFASGNYTYDHIKLMNVFLRAIPSLEYTRGGLATWNDEPSRTKQEVINAFRLAAKLEREVRT